MCEEMLGRPTARLLVTDLDNTLWDWFDAWYQSFSAMLRRLSQLSGVPQGQLENEIRAVHRARGTTEYSYLLNELPSLIDIARGEDPLNRFDEAIHVLNSVRLRATRLYAGVKSTLVEIKNRGIPVVAYSESIAYWTEWRIKKTGLDGVIDVLYTSPDHDLPAGLTVDTLRRRPPEDYGLSRTIHRHVQRGHLKPDPYILEQIVNEFAVKPSEVVYVGDSLMKDVVMAQSVGVQDVYAAYGVAQDRDGYDFLRRVSHWSETDIDRERELALDADVRPSYRLESEYSELLALFRFEGGLRGR